MDRSRINRMFNRLGRALEQQSRVMVQIVTQDDSIDAGNGLYWGMAQFREGQTLTRVRAPRTKPFPGAYYKAKASPDDGVLELLDPDPVTVNGFFAGLPDPMAALNTPNHGWTHRGPIGLDPLWVNPQQVLGLQTRPATPNSLSVVVTDYPPLAFAEATLDLTSYLPGPGYQRFVIVALNVTSGALAVTESATVSGGPGFPGVVPGAPPFTAADVAALAVDHNHLPSAAVRLYYGQTMIKWLDIFFDLRALAGQRDGYLRLDDADPTLDGLVAKLVAGPGVSISRQAGDALVLSATGSSGTGWDADAPPDDASALDDEFNDASFDTGLWTEYDSGALETVAETGGLLSLSQASQAFAILTGVYQAVPVGDFTIVCKLRIDHDSLAAAGSIQAGIVLWNNAGSDAAEAVVLGPGVWHDTSDHDGFGYGYFSSRVSLSVVNLSGTITAATWYYLRVRRSGTSYYFDWSTDGVTWTEQNFTDNMPFVPDHFGLGLYNGASGYTLQADADFFRYRDVFDGVGEPVYGRATGSDVVLPTGLSTALPASPAQGAPYYETDTHRLQVGDGGSYAPVAGAFSLMPDPVGDWLLPAGYQATWITLGSGISVVGTLQIAGAAIFLGGL